MILIQRQPVEPMRNLKISIVSLLLILIATLQVNAQVVKTPSNDAVVVTNSNVPQRGMTKAQVESYFGQPNSQLGPVGIPAIYRWDYGNYSVFFENNHVIHAVAH